MNRKTFVVIVIALVALLLVAGVGASNTQTPGAVDATYIAYQGRVKVGGAPFNGSGAFKFTIVDLAGAAAYWSNDGTGLSTAPFTPTASVALTVSNGLFNVLLGDTSIAGMTSPITPTVVITGDRALRVWFSDGAHGWQQLAPDAPLAAVPWALRSFEPTATPQPTATPLSNVAYTNQINTFTQNQTVQTTSKSGLFYNLYSSATFTNTNGGASIRVDSYDNPIADTNSSARIGILDYTQTNSDSYGHNAPLYGIELITRNYSTKYSYQLIGAYSDPYNNSTGYVTNTIGYYTLPDSRKGPTKNWYGYYVANGFLQSGGTIDNLFGVYLRSIDSGSITNYSIYTNNGLVHIGDTTEVSGTIRPVYSGTSDLGTSALAWQNVYARNYVTLSYGDYSDGVKMQDGTIISCTAAVARLRKSATGEVLDNGLPHMDYSQIPLAALVPARDEIVVLIFTSTDPVATAYSVMPVIDDNGNVLWYENVVREVVTGKTGANMDAMQSLLMCAAKEIDVKAKSLDDKLADLDTRLKKVELKVK